MPKVKSSSIRAWRAFEHFESNPAYNVPKWVASLGFSKNRFVRRTSRKIFNSMWGADANTEEGAKKQWGRFNVIPRPIQDQEDMRRNYLTLNRALRRVAVPKNAQVASIGCGAGSQELLLAEEHPFMRVTGVDVAKKLIKQANRIQEEEFRGTKRRVSFETGSFLKNNLPQKSFDVVTSLDAFHWERNWEKALDGMKALINPNSKSRLLVLTYRPHGTTRMEKESTQFVADKMMPLMVINKLRSIGFEIKDARSVMDKREHEQKHSRPIFAIIAQLK